MNFFISCVSTLFNVEAEQNLEAQIVIKRKKYMYSI